MKCLIQPEKKEKEKEKNLGKSKVFLELFDKFDIYIFLLKSLIKFIKIY